MTRCAIVAGLLLCLGLGTHPALAQEASLSADEPCRVDPDRLWLVTEAAADIAGVDPDLLTAIAWVESHDCDRALSPAGAAGLMQLMPETAAEFGVTDRFDPAQSALGGAKLLADLGHSVNGYRSLTLAEILAAYNAGVGAVERYGGVPPYEETRDYVREVLMLYLMGEEPRPARPRIGPRRSAARPRTVAQPRAPRPSGDAEIFAQLGSIRGARSAAALAAYP